MILAATRTPPFSAFDKFQIESYGLRMRRRQAFW